MNPPARSAKFLVGLPLAFGALLFALGFLFSFKQDKVRVAEAAQLAWNHLNYAMSLRDDMAVIDWSKNLEAMEFVSAFQVREGPRIVIEGGNRDLLPAAVQEGLIFKAPDLWIFKQAGKKDQPKPREFILVARSFPGPLFWGFFGLTACLLSCGISLGLCIKEGFFKSRESRDLLSETPCYPSSRVPLAAPFSIPGGEAYLFLDQQYVIQQISPEAADLLQKASSDLLQGHLFDLGPDPRLMEAIEKNQEVKLLIPFLSYPNLSARLKPDGKGTLLFLERIEGSNTTKNH